MGSDQKDEKERGSLIRTSVEYKHGFFARVLESDSDSSPVAKIVYPIFRLTLNKDSCQILENPKINQGQ